MSIYKIIYIYIYVYIHTYTAMNAYAYVSVNVLGHPWRPPLKTLGGFVKRRSQVFLNSSDRNLRCGAQDVCTWDGWDSPFGCGLMVIILYIQYIYIHIYIWVKIKATSLFSLTGIMVNKGNHPQMAEQFRLVKYYLPRYTYNVGPPRLLSYLSFL